MSAPPDARSPQDRQRFQHSRVRRARQSNATSGRRRSPSSPWISRSCNELNWSTSFGRTRRSIACSSHIHWNTATVHRPRRPHWSPPLATARPARIASLLPQRVIDAALSTPAVSEANPSQIAAISPAAMSPEMSRTGMRTATSDHLHDQRDYVPDCAVDQVRGMRDHQERDGQDRGQTKIGMKAGKPSNNCITMSCPQRLLHRQHVKRWRSQPTLRTCEAALAFPPLN